MGRDAGPRILEGQRGLRKGLWVCTGLLGPHQGDLELQRAPQRSVCARERELAFLLARLLLLKIILMPTVL